MKTLIKQFLYTFLFVALSFPVWGRSKRVNQIPNGNVQSCSNCHNDPNGGGARNSFGRMVEKKFLDGNGDVIWGPALASLDADGDGISNGDELQDQYGVWTSGEVNPGSSSFVSNPGDATSTKYQMITVHLSSMSPHVGQQLFMRAVDKSNGKEASRITVENLAEDQNIELNNLIAGHSYNIDFFADHNGNGVYDPPPTDHAWRIAADNIQGIENLEFSHNANFTDIDWKYLLTLNFSSMTPHIGQMLEFAIEEDATSTEIGRFQILSVPGAEFTETLSGLKLNREYKIKMYADLSGNGLYDAPPADHAWELKFTNSSGDISVDFVHNTDFKDIGWKYLYTLNLLDMNPHIGEMLELRVVRNDINEEIGRTKLNEILQPNFSVSIPDVELNHDYRVDFYADHNGNGVYDAPPADHAWRITFNTQSGNLVENFVHNTTFTDIDWPSVVGVDEERTLEPNVYVLKQNYPNPFNPSTNITFALKESGFVSLKVYDILGQVVATLVNRQLQSGNHSINFDASGLQSGTYIYRLQSDSFTDVKKMVLLK